MRKVLAGCCLFLLLLAPLLATDGEGATFHFDWSAFLGKVFNAVVLFGGLILILRKPLIRFLTNRGVAIREDFDNRQKKILDIQKQLDQLNSRLDCINEEVGEIHDMAKNSAETKAALLVQSGEKEAERILANAERDVNQMMDVRLRELRGRIAQLAIDHFREEAVGKIGRKEHDRIIERCIKQSGEIVEKSKVD